MLPEAGMCGHSRVGVEVGVGVGECGVEVFPFFSSKLPLLGVFPSAGRPLLPTILDIFQLSPSWSQKPPATVALCSRRSSFAHKRSSADPQS